ncbi:NUDIX domain-containing protein [candidate division KSB3 bacterium]|uniref:NUDIX domain-containing protein n=1 Tax=candidate division KSB3 bacterium TaxID=2044937 RepID=A0A9D5JTS9_9BACT|nr:NUDIX domain-containing protein [candidate division KSB3 bacterium]MBD3323827.1 NUDIX domain-containing protein [candidate division KSB3 bacterium]
MPERQIRPIALCIFQKGQQILVFEGYDPSKDQTFYRPLGGGIRFGERSADTAVREIKEELDADIQHLSYIGTLENIFVYNDEPGHEIIQLYRAEFVDPSLYDRETLEAVEDDWNPLNVVWKDLENFSREDAPLYPDGLLEILTQSRK